MTSAPPILLVHGAWHGGWCWGLFADAFRDAGFAVQTPDLPGHGAHAQPGRMAWYSIRDYVDAIAGHVEALQRPPFLIGHSMGGFVCQHLMARDVPLAGVGLLASASVSGVIGTTLGLMIRRPVDFAIANLTLNLHQLVKTDADTRELFLDSDEDPAVVAAHRSRLTDESYRAFLDMLVRRAPRIRNPPPVIVVAGEHDKIFPVATQRRIADHWQACCHVVPGAPHNLMNSKHWRRAFEHFTDWIAHITR